MISKINARCFPVSKFQFMTQASIHKLFFSLFQTDLQDIVDQYLYPIGLSVSILCLLLTFLLYSFLPQLRDLTGKFILAICAFLSMTFSLCLVETVGRNDFNVSRIITGRYCSYKSAVDRGGYGHT